MDPRPPAMPPATQEQEPILTFEEFIAPDRNGIPNYDNFSMHFAGGDGEMFYRTKAHYKRFASEHPDMAADLCDKIQNKIDKKEIITSIALRPFERDMYEAYKIMRSYGVSDRDLFS